ncbi:uncharacterized protein LOC103934382 [Pyrus x bretschneideri]|uniref:uncharacterized protein LOC103934382 n=1 Tax=Pyrus x bretschneideri TaxID=225117 RepID=UPI000511A3E8|nr:uncharacterized protein LOC103934382 [Pyrus x bretschneideri]
MTYTNLMNNYFNPNSVYIEEDFRRLFRMRRHVFKRLLHDVQQVNPYFRQKRDRVGRLDFSPHQKVYKDEYLREPNQEDLNRVLCKAEDRGFSSIIGSLDCMHWDWKNCPTRWQRGFSGRSRKPIVVLEVVASYDT